MINKLDDIVIETILTEVGGRNSLKGSTSVKGGIVKQYNANVVRYKDSGELFQGK